MVVGSGVNLVGLSVGQGLYVGWYVRRIREPRMCRCIHSVRAATSMHHIKINNAWHAYTQTYG